MTKQGLRMAAADLAVRCAGEQPDVLRLASFIVFFETYLASGMDKTEEQMRLFSPRKVKALKVIAGKKL